MALSGKNLAERPGRMRIGGRPLYILKATEFYCFSLRICYILLVIFLKFLAVRQKEYFDLIEEDNGEKLGNFIAELELQAIKDIIRFLHIH
jgi:hypothetical protein